MSEASRRSCQPLSPGDLEFSARRVAEATQVSDRIAQYRRVADGDAVMHIWIDDKLDKLVEVVCDVGEEAITPEGVLAYLGILSPGDASTLADLLEEAERNG